MNHIYESHPLGWLCCLLCIARQKFRRPDGEISLQKKVGDELAVAGCSYGCVGGPACFPSERALLASKQTAAKIVHTRQNCVC